MALGIQYKCTACGHSITAWDDGNPYYLIPGGEKVYAYHPSLERELCTGNDADLLCLECGATSRGDRPSEEQDSRGQCESCKAVAVVDVMALEGQPCPFCHQGVFQVDPNGYAIS